MLCGTLHLTETSGARSLGYQVDVAFMMRFLGVFGVDRLSKVNGQSCWVVLHDDGQIERIEPLHKGTGRPFDVAAWSAYKKEHPGASAQELRTGRKP